MNALYFKQYQFSPKWYFVLATIFFCALFIRLGFWQLHRAHEKEQLQTQFNTRLHTAAIPLTQLSAHPDIHYYPIWATGYYDNAHTIILDNKIQDHQVGYDILTPFIVDSSASSAVHLNTKRLLVDRGWVPANIDRRILPSIPAIHGQQRIMGHIYIAPGKTFVLSNELDHLTWPIRVETLDFKQLEKISGAPLYPFVLWLSPEASDGFLRNWQPVSISSVNNKGYAVQWFAFSVALIIIFFALTVKKKQQSQP